MFNCYFWAWGYYLRGPIFYGFGFGLVSVIYAAVPSPYWRRLVIELNRD